MPHVPLPPRYAGIASLFEFRPAAAKPLRELCDVLLRAPSSLTVGERELIAAFVSVRNGCVFCSNLHRAMATAELEGAGEILELAKDDSGRAPISAKISAKLQSLLAIADLVRVRGSDVTDAAVAHARAQGATDLEIHDTVLIAATFCLVNRYVDGLAAPTPPQGPVYEGIAKRLLEHGYVEQGPPPGEAVAAAALPAAAEPEQSKTPSSSE